MQSVGAGFNPIFFSNDQAKSIVLPQFVKFIELGLRELSLYGEMLPNYDISLHIARSPITETVDAQRNFINFLLPVWNSCAVKPLSIGLHLTGPRNYGMGRYGFSSHYHPSKDSEIAAIHFIDQLQSTFSTNIWIENANFYSNDIKSIQASWASTLKILDATSANLIIDLSHLIIDAHNCGVSPLVICDLIPWERVIEVHLSGIIVDSRGVFHDGHSQPVSEKVWNLFNLLLTPYLQVACKIITIEHTDPHWVNSPNDLIEDFSHLNQLLGANLSATKDSFVHNDEKYAKKYLYQLLQRWIPNLELVCQQQGIAMSLLYEDWLNEQFRNNKRVVLTAFETPSSELDNVVVSADSFLDYAKRILAKG